MMFGGTEMVNIFFELSSMMFGGTEIGNIFFELSSMMIGGTEIGNSCKMMPHAHVIW